MYFFEFRFESWAFFTSIGPGFILFALWNASFIKNLTFYRFFKTSAKMFDKFGEDVQSFWYLQPMLCVWACSQGLLKILVSTTIVLRVSIPAFFCFFEKMQLPVGIYNLCLHVSVPAVFYFSKKCSFSLVSKTFVLRVSVPAVFCWKM